MFYSFEGESIEHGLLKPPPLLSRDFCNSEEFCKSFGPGYLPCLCIAYYSLLLLLKSTLLFSPLLSPTLSHINYVLCSPAFHDIEDSLASFGPGTGDFPSISNFDHDHSLQLPQFPSDDETDTHATPSAPPNLATILESEVCHNFILWGSFRGRYMYIIMQLL